MTRSGLLCALSSFVVAVGCGTDGSPTRGNVDASSPDGAVSTGDASADAGPDPSVDAATGGRLFAFVGSSDGHIHAYAVDPVSGAFTLDQISSDGAAPQFLAFDSARRRVVGISEQSGVGLVRSFSFNPDTRILTEINSKGSAGAGATHVSLNPAGTVVFVANYQGGNAAVLPISAGGILGDVTDIEASGAKSHWIGTNPSGTHAFVVSLGADAVKQYAFNPSLGMLTANGQASFAAGVGPRHLAFHPSEKWAYSINELAVSATSFGFDKAAGTLTPKATVSALPNGQGIAGITGAEILVHPNGRYVYASTRGYNAIVVFSVNATDGTLTRVANVLTGADRPRSFGIDPEGTLLFAGNQDADEVVGFRIDGATGALTPVGKIVSVPGPGFVGLARMP